MQIQDGFQANIKPVFKDVDGVTVVSETVTITTDAGDQVAIEPDTANPGSFILTRVNISTITDGTEGTLTVHVTAVDSTSGLTAETDIEFVPGTATSLVLDVTSSPIAAVATPGTGTEAPPQA